MSYILLMLCLGLVGCSILDGRRIKRLQDRVDALELFKKQQIEINTPMAKAVMGLVNDNVDEFFKRKLVERQTDSVEKQAESTNVLNIKPCI